MECMREYYFYGWRIVYFQSFNNSLADIIVLKLYQPLTIWKTSSVILIKNYPRSPNNCGFFFGKKHLVPVQQENTCASALIRNTQVHWCSVYNYELCCHLQLKLSLLSPFTLLDKTDISNMNHMLT